MPKKSLKEQSPLEREERFLSTLERIADAQEGILKLNSDLIQEAKEQQMGARRRRKLREKE